MINSEYFIKRLEKVIKFYGLSSSAFAEKIGVQRSSISHILSGRNKPSLEFIMKVLSSFPEVDLYWLLNGKGEFPSKEHEADKESYSVNSEIDTIKKSKSNNPVKRIVILFEDGTFESYEA